MLVNVPIAVGKKGMTLRRIAILDLVSTDHGMHSTAIGKRLGVSRQLIDREVGLLADMHLIKTAPAHVGSSIKPHTLTSKGVKLLAELRSLEQVAYGTRTKPVKTTSLVIDHRRTPGLAPLHARKKAQNGLS